MSRYYHSRCPSYADAKRMYSRSNLFEDPDFKAVNASLFYSKAPPRTFVWKRPHEICDDPKMFVGGASRLDIDQGYLGDCWFLAATAGLSQYDSLLHKCVPNDQDFDDPDYCGVFRFFFWQYGEWQEVVIDDRLPTYNNKLVFVHSKERNEFWSALMEKAYAKLHGSYESLKGGQTSEAMEDFTGGVCEAYSLKDKAPHNLFKLMLKNVQFGSLMGCSINATSGRIEEKMDNGLVKGHAYTITGVNKVHVGGHEEELVRIRNPWGNEREWKGAWGDGSRQWNMIDDSEKERLGLVFEDDGEFWMSYDDFKEQYDRVELCMLDPENCIEDGDNNKWEKRCEKGRWVRGCTAGGCRNFPNTFASNPQFRITLEDPDEDEDDLCSVVIAVMQKDRRKQKRLGAQMLTIGYALYKLDDEAKDYTIVPKDYFLYNQSAARSPSFINMREISGRHQMPPGDYVIVPSTFDPDQEGDFILRIFSEKAAKTSEFGGKTEMVAEPKRPEVTREQDDALDDRFKATFLKVSGDDEQIDCYELQEIISCAFKSEIGEDGFSLEAARSMVALMDTDKTGKLGFDEFKELWFTLREWRKTFSKFDVDQSGDMSTYELRNALYQLGLSVSTTVMNGLGTRFRNKKNAINFDDFLQIVTRVKLLIAAYKQHYQNIDLTIKQGNRRIQYRGCAIFGMDEYVMSGIVL